ncbi:MAG: hypothetical protein EBV23_03830 [Flavobacteriia bacterium]|nr:hypothetical protein [Flavobacteriia bacterium]
MKRSEMFQLLYGKLNKELLLKKSIYDLTEKILMFLEEQGMQPPLNVDTEGFSFFYEWEPEDEKK